MTTGRVVRWMIGVGVPAAVAMVGYRNRDALGHAVQLMAIGRAEWLVVAAGAIVGVYLCRAFVYAEPLRALNYRFPRGFLWQAAVISTSLHQLLPAGGATGYAFLTYALHQRGVPAGEASLVALIDTLSHGAALASVVIGALVYLLASEATTTRSVALAFGPGVLLLGLAAGVYTVQRSKPRCLRIVTGAARWWGRPRAEARIREFLDEYFAGKAIIRRKRSMFATMIALQYVAVACDVAALSCALLVLGLTPKPWVMVMALVLSMAGGAVVSAPGGGGSFELTMAAFFSQHGLERSQGIAAALLYRLVAFWFPVALSVPLLLHFRQRRRDVRKRRRRGLGHAT